MRQGRRRWSLGEYVSMRRSLTDLDPLRLVNARLSILRARTPLLLDLGRARRLRCGGVCDVSRGGATPLPHLGAPTNRPNTEPLARGPCPLPSFGKSHPPHRTHRRPAAPHIACRSRSVERRGLVCWRWPRQVPPPRQPAVGNRMPARAAPLARPPLFRATRWPRAHDCARSWCIFLVSSGGQKS